MVRPKQGELFAEPASKNNTSGGFTDLSSSKTKVDLPEEDGWLIVKKQKVNILIPHLSASNQSNIKDPEPGHPQPMLGKQKANILVPPLSSLKQSYIKEPEPGHPQLMLGKQKDNILVPPLSALKLSNIKDPESGHPQPMLGKQKANILMSPPSALKQCNITDPEPGHPQPMLGRQKANILIPPLSALKQSNITDPETGHPQPMLGKRGSKQPQPETFSANESKMAMSVTCRKDIEAVRKTRPARAISTSAKLSKQDFVIESNNLGRDVSFRSYKMLRVSSPLKIIRRPALLHRPISLSDGNTSINQRLRASNIEKKLLRAGGLSQWLVSLGLSQFVRIFQSRRVGKFQLVNLTMKKLKEMGADAVGPRRKLMHAIDCLCQPHCFERKKIPLPKR